ncbi:MAG: hypothetical protein LKI39_00095 [Bacteroides sp.]|jgi:VIT1/CCC1 family predicted Fe2+/Mn2+ transporter|nr:hypothetical protein [Bacteroides sp.]
MIRSGNLSPKANKTLLIVNLIIFIGAIVLAVVDVFYREYIQAVAMLLVMVVTALNAYGCRKRMRGKL